MIIPKDITRLILGFIQGSTWKDCVLEAMNWVQLKKSPRNNKKAFMIIPCKPDGNKYFGKDGEWHGFIDLEIRAMPWDTSLYQFRVEVKWMSDDIAPLGVQLFEYNLETELQKEIPDELMNLDLVKTMPRVIDLEYETLLASIQVVQSGVCYQEKYCTDVPEQIDADFIMKTLYPQA